MVAAVQGFRETTCMAGNSGQKVRVVRVIQVGLAVTGAILLIIGLLAFVQPSNPTEKKDFIQAVGILLAGLVGLGGLYITWLNLMGFPH
jgi:hypothetical protein